MSLFLHEKIPFFSYISSISHSITDKDFYVFFWCWKIANAKVTHLALLIHIFNNGKSHSLFENNNNRIHIFPKSAIINSKCYSICYYESTGCAKFIIYPKRCCFVLSSPHLNINFARTKKLFLMSNCVNKIKFK